MSAKNDKTERYTAEQMRGAGKGKRNRWIMPAGLPAPEPLVPLVDAPPIVDEQMDKARAMDKKRKNKVSSEEILSLYRTPMTLDQVAAKTGLNRTSVHERLQKMGASRSMNILTDIEKALIESVYRERFVSGDGKLESLANEIGRTKAFVCRYAGEVGLTNLNRPCSDELKIGMSARAKANIEANGHPKGMLGKKHSEKTKERISESSSFMWANMSEDEKQAFIDKQYNAKVANGSLRKGIETGDGKKTWKAGWREIGKNRKYYRSAWEANYARVLQWLLEQGQILDWDHEVETFWFEGIKRGVRSYLPDFRVKLLDGSIEFHEVKGWMDSRSVTTIKRMAKYHPHIKLIVRDSTWFKANKQWRGLLPDWESK
ncbi:hypothetical protein [Hymenobacter koreensis]|uniref:Uncharacterized protein n=1 Tax=Hymenobacter koreensis TaxID=1084523 RepID=A0ABP8JK04_9BACT